MHAQPGSAQFGQVQVATRLESGTNAIGILGPVSRRWYTSHATESDASLLGQYIF
jgi:hypothetical protein